MQLDLFAPPPLRHLPAVLPRPRLATILQEYEAVVWVVPGQWGYLMRTVRYLRWMPNGELQLNERLEITERAGDVRRKNTMTVRYLND